MLILDLGLYPDSSSIRTLLGETGADGEVETLTLDAAAMSADEWDRVLEKILSADKCLTI